MNEKKMHKLRIHNNRLHLDGMALKNVTSYAVTPVFALGTAPESAKLAEVVIHLVVDVEDEASN